MAAPLAPEQRSNPEEGENEYSTEHARNRTDPERNWWQRYRSYRPKAYFIAPASFIFISGGMNVAASFDDVQHTSNSLAVSWFIAAIIGALIGSLLTHIVKRKYILCTSCILVAAGGILMIANTKDNLNMIYAARYFDGIANGLIFAPTFVLAGEILNRNLRGGGIARIEAMSLSLGVYLQLIFYFSWNDTTSDSFSPGQLQGLLSIVFAVLAVLAAVFLFVESPVWYLQRNQEELAEECLRRLHHAEVVTPETTAQLIELKDFVGVNSEMNFTQSAKSGLGALCKLCIYRAMNALCFSNFIIAAFITASVFSQGDENWPFILLGLARFLGAAINCLLLDPLGRKKQIIFAALICGALAVGIGANFENTFFVLNLNAMKSVVGLLITQQFFAGMLATSSSAYLSEAFPLAIKPYYIAVTFSVEMLVQIIICLSVTVTHFGTYFYTIGGLLFAFSVSSYFFFPETKKTTLREAQLKFSHLLTMGSTLMVL